MAGKGGKGPKQKGDRFERAVAQALGGERTFWQPEGGELRPDVTVPALGRGECKIRGGANGFKQLYGWLEGRDFVAVRADRMPALIVLRIDAVAALIQELDELKRRELTHHETAAAALSRGPDQP